MFFHTGLFLARGFEHDNRWLINKRDSILVPVGPVTLLNELGNSLNGDLSFACEPFNERTRIVELDQN